MPSSLSLRANATSVELAIALSAGASPNECDGCGVSLLHRFANDPAAVAMLLETGADPYSRSLFDAQQPIHFCLNPQSMVLLLDAGVSVDTVDGHGRTPLHFAAINGRAEVVELLLACGANPDAQDQNGLTALHLAPSREVVDHLLDAGADHDLTDRWGMASWQCYKHDGGLAGQVSQEINRYIEWAVSKRAADEERQLLEALTPLVMGPVRPVARL